MLVLFTNILLIALTVLQSRGRITVPCTLSVSWGPPDVSKSAVHYCKKKLYEPTYGSPCSFPSAMTTRNFQLFCQPESLSEDDMEKSPQSTHDVHIEETT